MKLAFRLREAPSRVTPSFRFADGLIAAADAGATCAIQPGGSVRDNEVIAAANERDIAMIFTGAGISGTRANLPLSEILVTSRPGQQSRQRRARRAELSCQWAARE